MKPFDGKNLCNMETTIANHMTLIALDVLLKRRS